MKNHSTFERIDYADDWRGNCPACDTEVTQSDAVCPVCNKHGTLSYFKEQHGINDKLFNGLNYTRKFWLECGWKCLNCGTTYDSLLCPRGDSIVTVPRATALLRNRWRVFLVQLAGFLAFYAVFMVGGTLCEAIGLEALLLIPFIGGIVLWVKVVKELKHHKKTWQRYWT